MALTTEDIARIENMIVNGSYALKNKTISGADNNINNLKANSFAPGETEVWNGNPTPTPAPTTNLISSNIEADWKDGAVIILPTKVAAPDGSITATTLQAKAIPYGGLLRLVQRYPYQNKQYTFSVWVKKDNHDFIGLRISNSTNGSDSYPFVNLSTLATNTLGIAGVTLNASRGINGWVQIKMLYTPVAVNSFLDIAMVGNNGASYKTFLGTEKVHIHKPELT